MAAGATSRHSLWPWNLLQGFTGTRPRPNPGCSYWQPPQDGPEPLPKGRGPAGPGTPQEFPVAPELVPATGRVELRWGLWWTVLGAVVTLGVSPAPFLVPGSAGRTKGAPEPLRRTLRPVPACRWPGRALRWPIPVLQQRLLPSSRTFCPLAEPAGTRFPAAPQTVAHTRAAATLLHPLPSPQTPLAHGRRAPSGRRSLSEPGHHP